MMAKRIPSVDQPLRTVLQGPKTPEDDQVWYASYHLTGMAQQWHMRLTQDKVVTDWA
jgi:hypothetical protein